MEKQLIYQINGKNYVLIEIPIASEYHRLKLSNRMKKHDAIFQSGYPKKSFWSTYVMVNVLVPETTLCEFNREGLD